MSSVYRDRRLTQPVPVTCPGGRVVIGGGAPVVVQSMTNTATEDVAASVAQVRSLAAAGSELVRLTVNTPEAARAIVRIRAELDDAGCAVPLVGDFHYNGHKLLTDYPECAASLSKFRINPGNVGKGARHDENFARFVGIARDLDKPVRIGVNGGSLDKELLSELVEANRTRTEPLGSAQVIREAIVESAVRSALVAESLGLPRNRIVLSAKTSDLPGLVAVYRAISRRGDWALHLGLTEAGGGTKGVVASSAALAVLLSEGIGDTIRVSITPAPGQPRTTEVRVAQELLQSMELRAFAPSVTSCPGCGRTANGAFQELAVEVQNALIERAPLWREIYPGSENLRVAVMGCVVNGPGESAKADIGISLPGRGEATVAPVYAGGVKIASLKGPDMGARFLEMIEEYVKNRWGKVSGATE